MGLQYIKSPNVLQTGMFQITLDPNKCLIALY